MWISIIPLALAAVALAQATSAQLTPICDSPIYCTGELLHTIQMARLHEDSKTFVDMKLKASPQATLHNFRAWKLVNPTPSTAAVRQFVADNFDAEGSEFQPYTPSDHTTSPEFLQRIKAPEYRQFASDLNRLWLQLGRNISLDVHLNPELYSIIAVPNAMIVPGDRFREYYYWDSYWIVLGLLHSEMFATVRGMLGNYVSIVERFGYIPNGGRIYYLGRSQPPLLIPMVKEYVDVTGDVEFVRDNIGSLDREFAYWFDQHKAVEVRGFTLSRYTDRARGPRPESYAEDRDYGARFWDTRAEYDFYAEVRAAAESGMDFSSRFFRAGVTNGTLIDLQSRSIVPVELNAVLFWNAKLLAEFHESLGNEQEAFEYRARASHLLAAMQQVFWNEDEGAWLDWDLATGGQRDFFVPTNLAPLWVGAYHRRDASRLSRRLLEYVQRLGLDGFAAGVPTSLVESGEQWDYPNVWPPMQHMLIVGLEQLGTREAQAMALKWTQRWVYSNYVAYNRTGSMFESYSANVIGLGGSGGEYEVQVGFGWSNGVVLDLLHKYGDRLEAKQPE